MNLKEHLQFLIMMIPTLLLLIFAAFTLASPAKATSHQPNLNPGEVAVFESDIGSIETSVFR